MNLTHVFPRVLVGCAALGTIHSVLAQEDHRKAECGKSALHIEATVPNGSSVASVILIPSTQTQAGTNYSVSGLLKFKFRTITPASVTGVDYYNAFCVGPADNACGPSTSIAIKVHGGGPATFALIDASAFANGNVLAVGNPTSVPIQIEADLE